ncbi:hypothetical protein QFZ96_001831 [Paraburkholderia youngii]
MADALPIIAVQPTEPSSRANALITSISKINPAPVRHGCAVRTYGLLRSIATSRQGRTACGVPPRSRLHEQEGRPQDREWRQGSARLQQPRSPAVVASGSASCRLMSRARRTICHVGSITLIHQFPHVFDYFNEFACRLPMTDAVRRWLLRALRRYGPAFRCFRVARPNWQFPGRLRSMRCWFCIRQPTATLDARRRGGCT